MAKLCYTPQAIAPIQLQPCDSCGRKFNLEALQRHIKVKLVMIKNDFDNDDQYDFIQTN